MSETKTLSITTVSFLLFLAYYIVFTPEYVRTKKDDKMSLRLCTVYSLLFSSAIGLLSLSIL